MAAAATIFCRHRSNLLIFFRHADDNDVLYFVFSMANYTLVEVDGWNLMRMMGLKMEKKESDYGMNVMLSWKCRYLSYCFVDPMGAGKGYIDSLIMRIMNPFLGMPLLNSVCYAWRTLRAYQLNMSNATEKIIIGRKELRGFRKLGMIKIIAILDCD